MPTRSLTLTDASYRFGFNGKEKDNDGEWGNSTHYDYGFRIYDPSVARFLSVDPLTSSYPWYTPYQFAGNMPIWAIDIDGLEPLIASEYKTMKELKTKIGITHNSNTSYQSVALVNIHKGVEVSDELFSTETSQEDLKKARNGGYWEKFKAGISNPRAVYYLGDLKKIENMSYKAKNKQKFAFQDIANGLVSKTLERKGKGSTLGNTYLHVAGQAIITTLFGEGVANYSGHLHEAAHGSLYTGIFTSAKDLENGIDNYSDMINNKWGQQFGKELKEELKITEDTKWNDDLTKKYLDGLLKKIGDTMEIKVSKKGFKKNKYIKTITKFINENK